MAALLQFQIIPNCKVLYLVQCRSMPSCLNTLCTMDTAVHLSLPLPGSPWQDHSFALHLCSLSQKRRDKAQMKHVCSFQLPCQQESGFLGQEIWYSRRTDNTVPLFPPWLDSPAFNTFLRTGVHEHLTNWCSWGAPTTLPASQNSTPHSK